MTEPTMVDVFSDVETDTNPAGHAIAELADTDPRIVTLTADLSTVLADFRDRHPSRYLELGIAETNSISVAAGLAACGYVPYIYSMSPFGVLKCAEQLRTDVAYTHLPVRLVGRLTGLAMGFFGTSHHAVEDVAIARTLTNLTVVAPADSNAVLGMMRSTATHEGPVYLRISEDAQPVYATPPTIGLGSWPHLREGRDISLIGYGMGVGLAVRVAAALAGEGTAADVYDAAYLKPYDEQAIVATATRTGKVLTIEDHNHIGGLGTLVAETVAQHKLPTDLARAALPDEDLEVAAPRQLYDHYGLTTSKIADRARQLLARH